MNPQQKSSLITVLFTLVSFAGLIVGFAGFMMVTMAWMNGTQNVFGWVVLVIGALMWSLSYSTRVKNVEREQMEEMVNKARKK